MQELQETEGETAGRWDCGDRKDQTAASRDHTADALDGSSHDLARDGSNSA